MVYFKTVTYKGKDRASKNGKLSPRYMRPYKILKRIRPMAYKLELLSSMDAFHKVFHVSMLRKYITDRDNVMSEPPPDLRENLTIEGRPVRIVGRKVKADQRKKVKMIQVVWNCDGE